MQSACTIELFRSKSKGSKVARKNLKWQVHEAVMDSLLLPPARLLMFVFADLADAETGEIPEERKDGASIKELARRSGYDPATVKRHKRDLIALGWLRYEAPDSRRQSSHETGEYTILIGRNPDPKPVAQSAPPAEAHSEPPPEAQGALPNGDPAAQGAPGGGAGCATPEAQGAPPIKGITNTDKNTNISLGPNADASAPRSAPQKRARKPKTEEPPRPDVDALCQRLAELMIANECKPPTITKAWRDEARRLLDLDGRNFEKALFLLEWSQKSKFWRKNILSMPTFREKYDQLRLDALAEWEQDRSRLNGTSNGRAPRRSTTDERLEQADAALIEAKRILRGGTE